MVAAGELQREAFELMMQMFSHDLKAYDNWVVRCQDRESAKYHAELQKRADRQREALKAAKSLMTENSREWMMSLIAVKDAAEGMLKVTEFLDEDLSESCLQSETA